MNHFRVINFQKSKQLLWYHSIYEVQNVQFEAIYSVWKKCILNNFSDVIIKWRLNHLRIVHTKYGEI